MDSTLERTSEYVSELAFGDLPQAVVHECKRRVIDTIGCALAAHAETPSVAARDLAYRVTPAQGARILGCEQRALPELAAFANGVMGRYLDGNDTYPGGGGHPSDTIAAALAAADTMQADGKRLITAIVAAYEVYHKLFEALPTRAKSIDNVYYAGVGSAAAAASVLRLDTARTAHALSLAITTSLALAATRHGELSMWKGCASGDAARNGVFSALLAERGITAPGAPVEGPHGLWSVLGKAGLAPYARQPEEFSILRSNLKRYLAEYHSQGPISLALALASEVPSAEIEKVTIHTYWFAWHVIGSERQKWRPATRETADHSLPYIVAAVLLDGRFSEDIFSEERLRDTRIHALADRIHIAEDPALTKAFPDRIPCRIELLTRGGAVKTVATDYPAGHYLNPMSDTEVEAKFVELTGPVLPARRAREALDLLWKLDEVADLSALYEHVRVEGQSR